MWNLEDIIIGERGKFECVIEICVCVHVSVCVTQREEQKKTRQQEVMRKEGVPLHYPFFGHRLVMRHVMLYGPYPSPTRILVCGLVTTHHLSSMSI